MKKSLYFISVLVLVVFGGATAVMSMGQSGANKAAGKPVQIGAILFLTGPQAVIGEEVRNALLLGMDEVNAIGGIEGHPVELLIQDSKDSPKDAIAAFNKVVQHGVPVVISTGDVVSLNLAPLARDKQIPLVTTIAAGPDIPKNNNWVFRVWVPADVQSTTIAEYASGDLSLNKVALLTINNEYGDASSEHFQKTFESSGGTVVAKETFGIVDRDVRAQIAKLTAHNPQAIVVMGFGDGFGVSIKQIRESGYQGLILSENTFSVPYFQQQTKGANEGIIFTSTIYDENSTAPNTKAFIEAYTKRFQRKPSYIAAFAYDSLNILIAAMQKSGISSQQIQTGLAATADFNGVTGKLGFNKEGDIKLPLVIKKMVNGQAVVIKAAP